MGVLDSKAIYIFSISFCSFDLVLIWFWYRLSLKCREGWDSQKILQDSNLNWIPYLKISQILPAKGMKFKSYHTFFDQSIHYIWPKKWIKCETVCYRPFFFSFTSNCCKQIYRTNIVFCKHFKISFQIVYALIINHWVYFGYFFWCFTAVKIKPRLSGWQEDQVRLWGFCFVLSIIFSHLNDCLLNVF